MASMRQNVYDYSFEMRWQRRRRVTRVLLVGFSIVLGISLFLRLVLFPVKMHSDSMSSDVSPGGALFVCPMIRTPRRGDVFFLDRQDGVRIPWHKAVVNAVAGFFTAQRLEPFGYSRRITAHNSVRRVLGLPGDTLYMKDYVLYIKPRGDSLFLTEFEMAVKPYNIHIYSVPVEWDGLGPCGDMRELTLGPDEYFVLADNRIEGVDSRLYGPVGSRRLRGRVLLQYFPLNRMRVF